VLNASAYAQFVSALFVTGKTVAKVFEIRLVRNMAVAEVDRFYLSKIVEREHLSRDSTKGARDTGLPTHNFASPYSNTIFGLQIEFVALRDSIRLLTKPRRCAPVSLRFRPAHACRL